MDLFDGQFGGLLPWLPDHHVIKRGDLVTVVFRDRTERLYLVLEKRHAANGAYELDLLADPEP